MSDLLEYTKAVVAFAHGGNAEIIETIDFKEGVKYSYLYNQSIRVPNPEVGDTTESTSGNGTLTQ